MAIRIAAANGNFTAAATWDVCSAVAACFLDSEANNSVLTTAYVESAAGTPGAVTVDGIAVKIASRNAAPVGTMSVRIAQGGVLVAGTEVFINVSDIDARAGEQGWYFFKFAAPVLLVAATAYTISAKTSTAAMVNLYRDATAGNWSRLMRSTTTGAPAAGDSLHILGEWTAAATKTDRTVTMDSTAATAYGDAVVANPPGATVGKGGILTWGTTAATNYLLRLATRHVIYRGGILNMGTTGTKCPRDGSQQLEFNCTVADGDFGLEVYGTHNMQGQGRTIAKDIVRCLMNTDAAAAATVLGVDTDTGWLNTDDIAIAATSRTFSEGETRLLSGNAGATTVTVTVGLTNAHKGTSPTQAEVLLLTRNVRIQSVSTTFMAYVFIGAAATVDYDWAAFRYLGATTAGKRGLEVATDANGSFAMSFCAIREFDNHGVFVTGAAADNIAIDNLTGYKVGAGAGQYGVAIPLTTGINWSLVNIDLVGVSGAGGGVGLLSYGGTLTNIRCNGFTVGLDLSAAAATPLSIHKAWSGFELHSNTQAGLQVDGLDFGSLANVNSWRNGAAGTHGGLKLVSGTVGELTIETGNFFGNNTSNVVFAAGGAPRALRLRTCIVSGDTTFAVTNGVDFQATACGIRLVLENCQFGVVTGIKVAHTNDINCNAIARPLTEIIVNNTKLSSATPIANSSFLRGRSVIRYQRVDQATNVHKTVYPQLGTITYETTTFRTAAPSQSLAPGGRGAGEKLESGVKRKRIVNAGTVAISAYVRKNAAYTGSAPRLMQRANPAIGVLVNTVIATHSAAADVWQQLSGVTAAATENGQAEFYVDCDGAIGAVFIDDWS